MALPETLALVYHARARYPDEVPLAEVYRDLDVAPGRGRPAVALNMVQTLDGALAVGGRAWQLGSEVDHYLFRTLRGWADAVLSGAGTLRANDVVPSTHPELQAARAAAGRPANPAAVVVTRAAAFGEDMLRKRFFGGSGFLPVVMTTPRARPADLARVRGAGAEVMVVPALADGRVDLTAGLRALADRGVARVVAEGGPGLNRSLVEARLLDELFLTLVARVADDAAGPVLRGLLGGASVSLSLRSELQYRAPEVREWYFRFAVSYADGCG
ncbi:MAG: dihydrofolate reductase family protein [Armatimonadota bacterium]|nr:dihydrofolate reductase family protein [Armatimonadota bacterium]